MKNGIPMQKTLATFREARWMIDRTERFQTIPGHPGGGVRKDLFGIIDAIALRPGCVLGVQVCGADFQSHVRKMLGEHAEQTVRWLESGAALVLIGWTRKKARKSDGSIGKAIRWTPRLENFVLVDDHRVRRTELDPAWVADPVVGGVAIERFRDFAFPF